MRIAVIVPGELPVEAREALQNELGHIVSPGTETTLFEIEGGRVRVAGDLDLSVPEAVKLAVDAEKRGFDAVILDGA